MPSNHFRLPIVGALIGLLVAGMLLCGVVDAPVRAQTNELDQLKSEIQRLNKARRFQEALPKARQALTEAERSLPPDDPAVFEHLLNIGETYLGLGDTAQAEIELLKSEVAAARMGERGRTRLARAALLLVELYTAQNRHVEESTTTS
jgi:hypothetical protein